MVIVVEVRDFITFLVIAIVQEVVKAFDYSCSFIDFVSILTFEDWIAYFAIND